MSNDSSSQICQWEKKDVVRKHEFAGPAEVDAQPPEPEDQAGNRSQGQKTGGHPGEPGILAFSPLYARAAAESDAHDHTN